MTESSINLEFFREIKRFFRYRRVVGTKCFAENIIGNVLAFVPFGFMLPVITPKNRKFINITILTMEFTLIVEFLQYILKVGIFDVDDILLNTIGGVIGYFFLVAGSKSFGINLKKGKKVCKEE